jgi:hypothetical protein
MIVGQKVVCVDDKFPLEILKYYTALPKKDSVYVIRQVQIGVNWKMEEGEVCLYLIGLNNPKSTTPPFRERGFNAERFRPLDEIKDHAKEGEPEMVYAHGEIPETWDKN